LPVLPIIDLLILMGWSLLAVGAVLKAVAMTTAYRPSIANLGPMDFLTMAMVCLVFAVALAARTWVKAHEPEMLARQRSVTGREPYRCEDYAARPAKRGEAPDSRTEGEEMIRPQGSV
jgi:hypothetical protein